MTGQCYDFGAMIGQMLKAKVSRDDINKAGGELTNRMLSHYARGVQPLHWRGEGILTLWCMTFRKVQADAPLCEIRRGHRASRTLQVWPRVQSMPAWPAAVPVAVKPIKRKVPA